MQRDYLPQALQRFTGCITVDELYDGPYCLLSIVDSGSFRRLLCRVIDHDATAADVKALLGDFQQALAGQGLTLQGVSTDGSSLYPSAIAQVFGPVPHQVCRFHVLSEITASLREAVVKLYKRERDRLPKLHGGRPRAKQQKRYQRVRARRQRLLELYRRRYDLVKRELEAGRERELLELLEPYPQLAQVRQVMQQVYGLYGCCCRSEALGKLSELLELVKPWQQVPQLKAACAVLNGPCLPKSLVYLDHRQLASTSNAVERSNRRHRKMQKSVYRVRTWRQIERRLAMDLLREQRAAQRQQCFKTLHQARAA